MLQKSMLDLRAFRLAPNANGRVTWIPTSEVYVKRILSVLFLWFVTIVLWFCTVEMPWQWEARQERQERRQELLRESQQLTRELLAEPGGLLDSNSTQRPLVVPFDDSTSTQNLLGSTRWQLIVPVWLTALTFVLLIFGLYWPISTCWNRVVLWRDGGGNIWMRFWFLWPRKRWVGHASATRLIPRLMQQHLFIKRRHVGTRWNWILQLNSEMIARLPNSPGTLAINSSPVLPDILIADQTHDPTPADKPPQIVRHWMGQVSQALGICAEQQRVTYQEVVGSSWNDRPIRISREATSLQIPTSQTDFSVSLDGMSPKEMQKLMILMAQLGQVQKTDDGQIEITIEQTNNFKDLSSDQIDAIFAALPPELRRHVESSKRKR